jgi:hypothetical protein
MNLSGPPVDQLSEGSDRERARLTALLESLPTAAALFKRDGYVVTVNARGRALFVNIQHPGEDSKSVTDLQSQWPGNKGYGRPGRPRSATIVITRTDGGVIGV